MDSDCPRTRLAVEVLGKQKAQTKPRLNTRNPNPNHKLQINSKNKTNHAAFELFQLSLLRARLPADLPHTPGTGPTHRPSELVLNPTGCSSPVKSAAKIPQSANDAEDTPAQAPATYCRRGV